MMSFIGIEKKLEEDQREAFFLKGMLWFWLGFMDFGEKHLYSWIPVKTIQFFYKHAGN